MGDFPPMVGNASTNTHNRRVCSNAFLCSNALFLISCSVAVEVYIIQLFFFAP